MQSARFQGPRHTMEFALSPQATHFTQGPLSFRGFKSPPRSPCFRFLPLLLLDDVEGTGAPPMIAPPTIAGLSGGRIPKGGCGIAGCGLIDGIETEADAIAAMSVAPTVSVEALVAAAAARVTLSLISSLGGAAAAGAVAEAVAAAPTDVSVTPDASPSTEPA